MLKRILLYFTLPIILLSCQEPKKFGDLKMDIETFNYDFPVEDFYAFNGNNDGSITADADASVMTVVKELKPIEITHYRVAPKRYNDSLRDIIGKEYSMRMWIESDSVAKYGDYYFDKVDMLQSLNKDLIGVACSDLKGDENKVIQLRDYIISKEGEPVEKIAFMVYDCIVYTWQKEDRVLALVVRYHEITEPPFIAEHISAEEQEVYTPSRVQVRLFSINNKYKDLVFNNLYRGEWAYMQYNDTPTKDRRLPQ
ncbi:hypothetical protein VSP10_17040 [Myroides odoratimimus]|uniref:hypothetical protein n=1 Tax=Myroides odoratimimus TaxID=76832 RepID=UPI002DB9176B|nr:hypothetical protein [Myroides odoratimimus]MEC4054479.1 hypothetical protein [Myroides odoratimimus]